MMGIEENQTADGGDANNYWRRHTGGYCREATFLNQRVYRMDSQIVHRRYSTQLKLFLQNIPT